MDVDTTVITDQLVETNLVERLFVVRSLDDGMFVDLHLALPAQALIEASSSPAELMVNLQPGIVEYAVDVASSEFVVLISPFDDVPTTGNIPVEGYARTFESNVLIIASDATEIRAEVSTTSADSQHTWGEFMSSLQLDPGQYTLFVGDESPEDGSLGGVTIHLEVQ